jgi:hypothetical protein
MQCGAGYVFSKAEGFEKLSLVAEEMMLNAY